MIIYIYTKNVLIQVIKEKITTRPKKRVWGEEGGLFCFFLWEGFFLGGRGGGGLGGGVGGL